VTLDYDFPGVTVKAISSHCAIDHKMRGGWVGVDYSQSANVAIASGAVLATGAGV